MKVNIYFLFLVIFSSTNLLSKVDDSNVIDFFKLATNLQRSNPDSTKNILYKIIDFADKNDKRNTSMLARKELANTFYFQNKLDSSIKYYEQSLKFAKKINDTSRVASINNLLGNCFRNKSEFLNAIENYDKANTYYHILENKRGQSFVYNNKGLTFLKMSDYNSAIEQFKKSLLIKKNLNDSVGMAKSYGNIGLALVDFGDINLAISNFKMSLKIIDSIKDSINTPKILNHLGEAYLKQMQTDSSIAYFNRSLSYSKKYMNSFVAGISLIGLSSNYLLQGDVITAESYNHKAYSIFEPLGADFELANVYLNFAKIYLQSPNEKKFNLYINKAIEIIENQKLKKLNLQLFDLLIKFHNFKKDYKNALKYTNLYYELLNEINNEEFIKNKNLLEYELKEKLNQQRIKTISDKNILIEDKFATQKKFMYSIFIFFILILLALVYLFKNYNDKKKLNYELKKQIETKSKFFSIIAHDLKSPLSAFKILTSQMNDFYEELNENDKKEFIDDLSSQSASLYKLLENLLTWSSIETKSIKFNPEKFDLHFVINLILERNSIKLTKKKIRINTDVKENSIIYFDVQGFDIVFSNILSNAIKYSYPDSDITIKIDKINNQYLIKISDAGIGISKSILNNINTTERRITKRGTLQETGTGLGIIIANAIINENDGEIKFESELGKGTTVTIKLPANM
ncbi:tetratricopeptide repeat-containing sensor histidine kinase [Candidatus Kapabacteria bacterium]|nr:tetratricopeptide repeat-containing sensor histidine kinase [Candidatus Kapabacteria bacterium]